MRVGELTRLSLVTGGAPGAHHGVVTLALGARYRLVDGMALSGKRGGMDVGATCELPISNSGDLFGWRVTSDLIGWLR